MPRRVDHDPGQQPTGRRTRPDGSVAWHVSRFLQKWVLPLWAVAALLVLFGGALLFSDQGRDLVRAAEGDSWAALRLAAAVLIVIAVSVACVPSLWPAGFSLGAGSPGASIVDVLVALSMGYALPAGMITAFSMGATPLAAVVWAASAPCLALLTMACHWLNERWAGAVVGGGLALVIALFPAEVGEWLGSPLLMALAIAGWILLVARISSVCRGAGISLALLLLGGGAAVVLVTGLLDILSLRQERDRIRGTMRYRAAPSLRLAYDEVLANQPQGRPVVIIVAAAGGGIRASYWTSLVLATATDRASSLGDKLLLASGVSGGSLGLSLYTALLSVPQARCTDGHSERLGGCVVEFHRHDLLAGIVGSTLTGQVLNMLVPVFPRRSEVLEKTWQERWARMFVASGANPTGLDAVFAAPFQSLWRAGRAGPALVLNTTSIRGGDRLVVSNVRSDWLTTHNQCRANIAEHLELPLSAAANASARFPYLEDWGWFGIANAQDALSADCLADEGVADGGFFDNYGAATALDVYRWVDKIRATAIRKPLIFVIQITSDPDCAMAHLLDAHQDRASECQQIIDTRQAELAGQDLGLRWLIWPFTEEGWAAMFHNSKRFYNRHFHGVQKAETSPGPLSVAMQARAMTGIGAARLLREEVLTGGARHGDSYYHFSMAGAIDAPLGWALSARARNQIGKLLEAGANRREMDRLVGDLSMGK